MSGLYAVALETICGPYLKKPQSIPRAWNDMTPSEQAMTLWFSRKYLGAKEMEEVCRHAVAQTAEREGGYDHETANTIFDMFYNTHTH